MLSLNIFHVYIYAVSLTTANTCNVMTIMSLPSVTNQLYDLILTKTNSILQSIRGRDFFLHRVSGSRVLWTVKGADTPPTCIINLIRLWSWPARRSGHSLDRYPRTVDPRGAEQLDFRCKQANFVENSHIKVLYLRGIEPDYIFVYVALRSSSSLWVRFRPG